MLCILDKYEKVISLIEKCKNNEGEINCKKVHLKLIDKYNISLITAKKYSK